MLDDDVEKVAVAECAFSMGRNIEWLLEGGERERTTPLPCLYLIGDDFHR